MKIQKAALFALILAVFPLAQAVPLCTDYTSISHGASSTSASMQDYVNLGVAGCQLQDKIFGGFTYVNLSDPSGNDHVDPVVPASNVTVTAEDNALNPVFTFSA